MIERLQLPALGAPPLEVGPNELDLVSAPSTSTEEMRVFFDGITQGRIVLVEHETVSLNALRPKHFGQEELSRLSPEEFRQFVSLREQGRVTLAPEPGGQ